MLAKYKENFEKIRIEHSDTISFLKRNNNTVSNFRRDSPNISNNQVSIIKEDGVFKLNLLGKYYLITGLRGSIIANWSFNHKINLLGIIGKNPSTDDTKLYIFKIGKNNLLKIYESDSSSIYLFDFAEGFIWIEKDQSFRPYRLRYWSISRPDKVIFEASSDQHKISINSFTDTKFIFIDSSGDESDSSYIVYLQDGLIHTKKISSEQDNSERFILVDEGICSLSIKEQAIKIYSADGEILQIYDIPKNFLATDLFKNKNLFYVKGRSGKNQAIWIPKYNDFCVAPEAGVIDFYSLEENQIMYAISSIIHEPQVKSSDATAVAVKNFHSKVMYAQSKDGNYIPITLYSKDSKFSNRPVVSVVYGSYGIPLDCYYDPMISQLISLGIIVALCHVRGGGEYGEQWHIDGKKLRKQNSLEDYLQCIDLLTGISIDEKVCGIASSAGAIVLCSAILLNPEKFNIVQLNHPFITPERILSDPDNPLSKTDRAEFGNPRIEKEFNNFKNFSPYSILNNIDKINHFPPLFITAGEHDRKAPLDEIIYFINSLVDKLNLDIYKYTINNIFVRSGNFGHSGEVSDSGLPEGELIAMGWLIDRILKKSNTDQ